MTARVWHIWARLALVLHVTAPFGAAQTYSRWVLAEGAANAFFEEEILIGNPNAAAADIRITYLLPQGGPFTDTFTIPATSRRTVRVNSHPNLDGAGAVSAVVECTNGLDVVVERSMYWASGQRYAGHNSAGVTAAATEWFLAEGSTGFFNTFVLLANPNGTQTASATVSFLRPNGTTVQRTYQVQPNQRQNIWVNVDVPELANSAFSTIVRATNGVPLVVERAMYFGTNYRGGHESAGVREPATSWYFAEGFTGPGGSNPLQFDTFILLANPNAASVTATVTFFRDVGGPIERQYTLLPTSRENIWVDLIPELATANFSARVTSTGPIIAERAMYWGSGSWSEATNSPGVTAPALAWAFAEGVEDGIDATGTSFDSYFLVANPNAAALAMRATFMREDGTGIVRDYLVPASSRFTLATSTLPALSNQRFATFLSSTNGTTFVAERAVYWGNFTGGHAGAGTLWTGPIGTPATPPNATVTGISPNLGTTSGGTPVTITGTNFAQGATVSVGGAPASSVVVVNATTVRAVTGARVAGVADVTVTSNAVAATLAGAFTYAAPPVVSSIAPATGSPSGGTAVTITGSNFTSGATVRLGGVAATSVVVVNATTITAVTGAHAPGEVDVEVTAGGLTGMLPGGYRYGSATPLTSTETSLAFGDSITFGTSSQIVQMGSVNMIAVTTVQGYPQRLQSLLQARYTSQAISVFNSGAQGECASAPCTGQAGRTRLSNTVNSSHDLVVLLEGVNDINAGVAIGGIASSLRQMVQAAKAGDRAVVLCTLTPVKPDDVNGFLPADPVRIKALNEEIVKIAADEDIVLFDAYGTLGGDAPNSSLLSPDGLHPNTAGYQALADALATLIRQSFETSSGS